jgi:hypothetical protein
MDKSVRRIRMEIKGSELLINGYKVTEMPSGKLPETWSCPEDLGAMQRQKLYIVERFLPKSCFPTSVTAEELNSNYSREEDLWGTGMIPLKEGECCWTCRIFDAWGLKLLAEGALNELKNTLEKLKTGLTTQNPELANKPFDFAIDGNSRVKVLDIGNRLSNMEIDYITRLVNESSLMRELLATYTSTLAELTKLYAKTKSEPFAENVPLLSPNPSQLTAKGSVRARFSNSDGRTLSAISIRA